MLGVKDQDLCKSARSRTLASRRHKHLRPKLSQGFAQQSGPGPISESQASIPGQRALSLIHLQEGAARAGAGNGRPCRRRERRSLWLSAVARVNVFNPIPAPSNDTEVVCPQ